MYGCYSCLAPGPFVLPTDSVDRSVAQQETRRTGLWLSIRLGGSVCGSAEYPATEQK
jgi:hypothetical protein